METLAQRLIAARTAKGLTQGELAKAAGLKGQSIIGMLESGARKSSSYIPLIANVLGVSALWLSHGEGPKTSADRDADHTHQPEAGPLLLSANSRKTACATQSPPDTADRWPLPEADWQRFAALPPEGRGWALAKFAAALDEAEARYLGHANSA